MTQKIYQKPWFWYAIALVIMLLDQWSKIAVVKHFVVEGASQEVTSFFNLVLAYYRLLLFMSLLYSLNFI